VTADWISAGIGVIELAQGMASGNNGVSVQSSSATYHVGNYPAQGTDLNRRVLNVWIETPEREVQIVPDPVGLPGAFAGISLYGTFDAADEGPPVLANVGLYCDEQSGNWDTGRSGHELIFTAAGQPTPIGPPDDPRVRFRCRLELKVSSGDNTILHFALDVNQHGQTEFLEQDFEAGSATLNEIPLQWMDVVYTPSEHG
jgi:hypothetical protein